MQKRGQGALEYLLIIGGAIILAAIVITLLMSAGNPTAAAAKQNILDGLCAKFSQAQCGVTGSDPDGTPASGQTNCSYAACTWTTNICKGVDATGRCSNCLGGNASATTGCA